MSADGKLELIDPDNAVLAIIDYQPQMYFGVESHNRASITNNVVGLAKAAQIYGVPTILSTVETEGFSGHTIPPLMDVLHENEVIERTSMNSWEDENFVNAVKATGRTKLVISALWTEVCLAFAALGAKADGFDVYAVVDSSAGTSQEAHDTAIQRMAQAGIVPITWIQFALELQRDWARKEHYDELMAIVRDHGGAYGIGVEYASTMVHGNPQATKKNK